MKMKFSNRDEILTVPITINSGVTLLNLYRYSNFNLNRNYIQSLIEFIEFNNAYCQHVLEIGHKHKPYDYLIS